MPNTNTAVGVTVGPGGGGCHGASLPVSQCTDRAAPAAGAGPGHLGSAWAATEARTFTVPVSGPRAATTHVTVGKRRVYNHFPKLEVCILTCWIRSLPTKQKVSTLNFDTMWVALCDVCSFNNTRYNFHY